MIAAENNAMTNPWEALDVDGDGPHVLDEDKAALAAAETLYVRKGVEFERRYGYHTNLLPDPFTGDPDAPIVVFTLNPGYTDDAKALRWRNKGCSGSDDWWHAKSELMRAHCFGIGRYARVLRLWARDPGRT